MNWPYRIGCLFAMDHLPQQDTEHIHVPFVAEPRRYTPDDFFSLPKSVGCSVTGLLQSGPGQLPEDKAPGFLQAWLFFALLAQVLNEDVDSGQFLHHRHGRRDHQGNGCESTVVAVLLFSFS